MSIDTNPNTAMKLFGIGLSKTGTTSLASALQILGFKVKDNPGILRYVRGDLSSIERSVLEDYEALTDTPIPSFYRELDTKYPNAKFILTVRDMDGWLKSCKKQFNRRFADKQSEAHNALFSDLYECSIFDEDRFRNGYNRFVGGVLGYFSGRPRDLLILNVTEGDGWEELCAFLDKPVPDIPFPKANVTQIRWMDIKEVAAIARHAGEQLMRAYHITHRERVEPSGTKGRASASITSVVTRARYALCSDLPQTAARRAYRLIGDRLKALNPGIPIISPHSPPIPYTKRREWNHFWLVDPLENAGAFLSSGGNFTVNIALIEDRKPVIGVVYAPLTDTIYYAASRKDAFHSEAGTEPRQLEPSRVRAYDLSDPQEEADIAGEPMGNTRARSSKALAMCLIADGRGDIEPAIRNSMEWETAAAQAVLNAVSLKVTGCNSRKELTYNKETLANGCIVIA